MPDSALLSPVSIVPGDQTKAVENDVAVSLSGGGYPCDASVRSWLDTSLPAPTGFPYPAAGV